MFSCSEECQGLVIRRLRAFWLDKAYTLPSKGPMTKRLKLGLLFLLAAFDLTPLKHGLAPLKH